MPRLRTHSQTLAVLLLLLALPAGAQEEPAAPAAEEVAAPDAQDEAPVSQVLHARVDSIIHPVTAQFLAEVLAEADEANAEALIVELSTPGGLLTSTREIFKGMLTARTPVVVFVGPSGAQAASAGFFLLMASDVAAMAPGTNTGAAHPVAGQGQDIEGHMGEKVEQDAAASIRSLAGQHGRNVELAEAAVVESRSFSAEEALENGLIELVADDVAALVEALDGRNVSKMGRDLVLATAGARLVRREMRPFQQFLSILVHPEIAYLLMAFGFLGLYMELSNPGAILPGVVGAICLIVGFYALSVLPLNYAGVALIFLAMVFFVAEVHVMSHGLLTLAGVVSLVLGSVMLFKDADPALRVGLQMILIVAGSILSVAVVLLIRAIKVRGTRVTTGAEGLLRQHGVARSALQPQGKVFIHGELWNAEAEAPVEEGATVEVLAVEGLKLKVRATDK